MTRRRLDAELVRRGLAASRTEAQAAVREGLVLVAGRPGAKPSTLVEPADAIVVSRPARRFVSRGGEKLAAALDRFAIDPSGRECLDVGASTGGFTDCLLRRGARHVVALDVGYGQLAWSLREDARVSVLDRTNVRDLQTSALPYVPTLIVGDLSFISLSLVAPALARVAAPWADAVLLVKPQFEAGPPDVGRGGVVRDPDVWRRAIEGVMQACAATGLQPIAVMPSPLRGPAGNVEFPLHLVHGETSGAPDIDAALEAAIRMVGAA
ncbi:MAG TPA: TlyA family RNA methyltransferase [Actinomycetota bacterium]|nr:TlyA family RNA methyltransferase [Actinomycetota bacterium]